MIDDPVASLERLRELARGMLLLATGVDTIARTAERIAEELDRISRHGPCSEHPLLVEELRRVHALALDSKLSSGLMAHAEIPLSDEAIDHACDTDRHVRELSAALLSVTHHARGILKCEA